MKPAILALGMLLGATSVAAHPWTVQYLAYDPDAPDYPLAFVVSPGEHEFMEAYHRDDDGRGIYLGCDPRYAGGGVELRFGQRGDFGFLSDVDAIIVQFDNGTPFRIDGMRRQEARFWTVVDTDFVEQFTAASRIWVQTGGGETVVKIPLDGAADAIAMLDCVASGGV